MISIYFDSLTREANMVMLILISFYLKVVNKLPLLFNRMIVSKQEPSVALIFVTDC